MPELPEVETVCRGLRPVLVGRRLVLARALRPDLRRPLPAGFEWRLEGRRIEEIARRGKYMIWGLDDGWALLCHLGMSGRMVIGPAGDATPLDRHDHVVFETDRGRRVVFHDPRRFGLMDLAERATLSSHPLLAGLGPEPLDDGFRGAVLARALAGRRMAIKQALLDQGTVAGLGNIYVSEALFRAGIAPSRPAFQLAGPETDRLAGAIRDVLTRAIAAGGSSLRDHRQPTGELGTFQHSFAVYGRDGQPCPTPSCTGRIVRAVQGGRSTYYCPRCQR